MTHSPSYPDARAVLARMEVALVVYDLMLAEPSPPPGYAVEDLLRFRQELAASVARLADALAVGELTVEADRLAQEATATIVDPRDFEGFLANYASLVRRRLPALADALRRD